ncbi:TetR family transcriptional regulator [Sphingobium sufflavum]|uniref:TetR/AcrR family transcriptional regulator n=1 Tax=Sphingobium sufflavum TaxID=1129547 RepID=UPI001F46E2EA|nr:TetR/AcrR family transcriptional regulator [Sphingobium sufflavum]MCE7795424.1 TetR family transcriptional regulator [Sphingobium sufflavum]
MAIAELKPEDRRRDPVRTRARILAAAVEVFGRLSYAQAGLRDISARAGVASSLPVRYFGTKAALFEAALVETVRTNSVFTWQKANFGETMMRLIHDDSNVRITAMLMSALADPESRDVAVRVWQEHMIAPLAQWLGPPDADGRANTLFALMSGLTFQVHGLAAGNISPASARWAAQAMQEIVDGGGNSAA